MQDPSESSTGLSPTVVNLGLHVEKTKAYIDEIQGPLDELTVSIDALQSQTTQIALSGEIGTKPEILKLRQKLYAQDRKHKYGLSEIQRILDEVMDDQVMDNMKRKVEEEITNEIDILVQEQVSLRLKDHIPQELQDEVASSKKQLEELNHQLHNSESRRSNANNSKTSDPLATMFMTDGTVSPRYPKDVKELFALDGETTKALMKDYGLLEPSESRDHNLNRFMQFCGVRYQLVPNKKT